MSEQIVPTCDGRCCAVFYLPISRDEMTPARMARVRDGTRIFEMVLPLVPDAAAMRLGRDVVGDEAAENLYTCRYFDERTRRYVQYETRPAMCRDYPYGEPCSHHCEATA